jgi:hypothetical protein
MNRLKFTTHTRTSIARSYFKVFHHGLLANDAVKFHVKFGIVFVHLSSNCIRQICFFPVILGAPSVVKPLVVCRAAQIPVPFYTHTQNLPLLFKTTGSSTTSKFVAPQMTVNNLLASLVPLLSSSATQKLSDSLLCSLIE